MLVQFKPILACKIRLERKKRKTGFLLHFQSTMPNQYRVGRECNVSSLLLFDTRLKRERKKEKLSSIFQGWTPKWHVQKLCMFNSWKILFIWGNFSLKFYSKTQQKIPQKKLNGWWPKLSNTIVGIGAPHPIFFSSIQVTTWISLFPFYFVF